MAVGNGCTSQNPDPALHPNGGIFDLSNTFRGGDIVQNAAGVLNYSFNLYRIQPTQGADYTPVNPRTAQPGDVGGSLQAATFKAAFIYKPASVTPAGSYAVLDDPSSTDPNNLGSPKNHPALAQTFQDNGTGGLFTAVVNHLKSKGSSCGAGDDDPEQGNCNLTRTLAGQALRDWLATDPTNSGDFDFLIIGDLNAYDKEGPIDALAAGADDTAGTRDDFTDLLQQFVGEYAYTYVFSGQFGYLDYGLANQPLLNQVTGATVWHINSDEPDILDYDTSFKKDAQDALYEPNAYRLSDHDPVILGLELSPYALNIDRCSIIENGC